MLNSLKKINYIFLKKKNFFFNYGDIIYLKYIFIEIKKKKYFLKKKNIFGKLISLKKNLIINSIKLRKLIKLNELEIIILTESPFLILFLKKKQNKKKFKKLLYLKKVSLSFSKLKNKF